MPVREKPRFVFLKVLPLFVCALWVLSAGAQGVSTRRALALDRAFAPVVSTARPLSLADAPFEIASADTGRGTLRCGCEPTSARKSTQFARLESVCRARENPLACQQVEARACAWSCRY